MSAGSEEISSSEGLTGAQNAGTDELKDLESLFMLQSTRSASHADFVAGMTQKTSAPIPTAVVAPR